MAVSVATTVYLYSCIADNHVADCFAGGANGTYGPLSKAYFYNCEAYNPGVGRPAEESNQSLTTHDGFAFYDYGGYYHAPGKGETVTPGMDPSGNLTVIELYGTHVIGGVAASRIENAWIESNGFSKYGLVGALKDSKILSTRVTLHGTELPYGIVVYGQRALGSTDIRIENCLIEALAGGVSGIYISDTGGITAVLLNNRIIGVGNYGVNVNDPATTVTFNNNVINSTFMGIARWAGTVNGDYNTIVAPGGNPGYTPGPHDQISTSFSAVTSSPMPAAPELSETALLGAADSSATSAAALSAEPSTTSADSLTLLSDSAPRTAAAPAAVSAVAARGVLPAPADLLLGWWAEGSWRDLYVVTYRRAVSTRGLEWESLVDRALEADGEPHPLVHDWIAPRAATM
jgi:hypothetical protein